MKCICGYERLHDWQTNDNKEVGDQDFIRIDCFGKPFETDKKTDSYSRTTQQRECLVNL